MYPIIDYKMLMLIITVYYWAEENDLQVNKKNQEWVFMENQIPCQNVEQKSSSKVSEKKHVDTEISDGSRDNVIMQNTSYV